LQVCATVQGGRGTRPSFAQIVLGNTSTWPRRGKSSHTLAGPGLPGGQIDRL